MVYYMIHDNSASGGADVACFKGNHGKTFSLNTGSTDTHLFRNIMGVEKGMGRLVK